jgi:hypothetical protein
MPLPKEYVEEVCKPGQNENTCAFLLIAPGGWDCAKSNSGFIKIINDRLAEGSFNAKSDNCPGKSDRVCAEGFYICANAEPRDGMGVCSFCFEGDLANCKFDPPHQNSSDCRSRCTNPDGACPEGETLYEKKGLNFDEE